MHTFFMSKRDTNKEKEDKQKFKDYNCLAKLYRYIMNFNIHLLSPVVMMTRDFVGQSKKVSSFIAMDLLIGNSTAGL